LFPTFSTNPPEDQQLDIVKYARTSRHFVTVRDLRRFFEECRDVRGQGQYILADAINVGVAILNCHFDGKYENQTYAATTLFLTPSFREDFDDVTIADPRKGCETMRGRSLRRLLLPGSGPSDTPTDYFLRKLKSIWSSLLIPYHVNDNHFIILEVAWRSDDGRYIKVWDPMMLWQLRDGRTVDEIKTLVEVFLDEEDQDEVDIRLWELGDPTQVGGAGCGPSAFLTMCYLFCGVRPRGWSDKDEAVTRNYMWACLISGKIEPLPRLKLT
jgi:hypothetical protein